MQGDLQFQLMQDLTARQVKPNKTITKAHLNSIECLAAHPDNKVFASGSHDHTIKIWDMEKAKETMQLADHKQVVYLCRQGVWSVQYSNDGNQLLSASPDTLVQIWDSKKGSVGARLQAHKDKVYDARFSQSNKHIASCGIGGQIHIWDVQNLTKPLKTLTIPQMFAYHIEFTTNDQLMFVTTWESKLYTFDGKTFQQLSCQTITNRQDSKCEDCTTNFSLLPGRVFVATDRGTIGWYEYNSKTRQTMKQIQFTAHMDECRSVKLHPKKKTLVSTSRDGSVRLWDCSKEGRPKLSNNLVFHSQKVSQALFMDDWIITGSWDQSIGMWKSSEFLE